MIRAVQTNKIKDVKDQIVLHCQENVLHVKTVGQNNKQTYSIYTNACMYTCKCTLGCDIGFLESNYLNLGPFFNKFPFKKNIATQKDLIKSVAVDVYGN